jgi:hypothetical protein
MGYPHANVVDLRHDFETHSPAMTRAGVRGHPSRLCGGHSSFSVDAERPAITGRGRNAVSQDRWIGLAAAVLCMVMFGRLSQ